MQKTNLRADYSAAIDDIDQRLNNHMFVNCFNLVDICAILDLTRLNILQATTLFNDCKAKYKSSRAFKIFQHTRVDLGTDNYLILEFIKAINLNLKSPIIKSLYEYIVDLIELLTYRQEEINELREELTKNRIPFKKYDEFHSKRQTSTAIAADYTAKKELIDKIRQNFANMQSKKEDHPVNKGTDASDQQEIQKSEKPKPADISALRSEFINLKNMTESNPSQSTTSQSITNSISEISLPEKPAVSNPSNPADNIKKLRRCAKRAIDFEEICSLLRDCAEERDFETITYAFNNGYCDVLSSYQKDIFMETASHGSIPLAKALVALKYDTKKVDKYRMSALHWAIKDSHPDFAEYLISNKLCDVNLKDCNELTPLHYAAARNDLMSVKALCEAEGIKINQSNSSGKTAFDMVGTSENADPTKTQQVKDYMTSKGAI